MREQRKTFNCYIIDRAVHEHFYASISIVMKTPFVGSSTDARGLELAHVYITALADRWKGPTVSFTEDQEGQVVKSTTDIQYAVKGDRSKDHSHFVLLDASGYGKYIRRNKFGTDVETRQCSMWDLGPEFGTKVAETVTEFLRP